MKHSQELYQKNLLNTKHLARLHIKAHVLLPPIQRQLTLTLKVGSRIPLGAVALEP